MEIPACRGTHPPQQGEFVIPERQAALHLQVSFGRDQPEGGYAFQEGAATPLRIHRPGAMSVPSRCIHGTAARTPPPRQPVSCVPAPPCGNKPRAPPCRCPASAAPPAPAPGRANPRHRARRCSAQRANPATPRRQIRHRRRPLVEQLATVIQFVFRGVVQVFQVQQNIDTFAGIRLRLVSRFQRIYEMRRRCRGRSDHPSDSQQRPQGFFHISWNWRSNIGI